MNPLVIIHHIGLGDHLMLNGMVRHLCVQRKVAVIVLLNHKESVEFMYRDNQNIEVFAFEDVQKNLRSILFNFQNRGYCILPLATYAIEDNVLKALAHGNNPYSTWAHAPYFQAKVNPEYMRTKFYVFRDRERERNLMKKLNLVGKDYIFVHNEPDRHAPNVVESKYEVFNPNTKETPFNVFDYLGVLENAKEIHCINSAWAWVVELFRIGSKETNFMNSSLSNSHSFQPVSTVKMVFTDSIWTFKDNATS
jgi:hypothetical protein